MAILAVHTRKTPLATNVRLEVIVRGIPEFTAADISNLANKAALLAARRGQDLVVMNDFAITKDKAFMGNEGRSMIITEEEKRYTAYHESGHAPVAKWIPGTDPTHKVSVIPRGRSMGVTQHLPGNDRHTYAWSASIIISVSEWADQLQKKSSSATRPPRQKRHRTFHRVGPQDGVRVRHEQSGTVDLGPGDQPAVGRGDVWARMN